MTLVALHTLCCDSVHSVPYKILDENQNIIFYLLSSSKLHLQRDAHGLTDVYCLPRMFFPGCNNFNQIFLEIFPDMFVYVRKRRADRSGTVCGNTGFKCSTRANRKYLRKYSLLLDNNSCLSSTGVM